MYPPEAVSLASTPGEEATDNLDDEVLPLTLVLLLVPLPLKKKSKGRNGKQRPSLVAVGDGALKLIFAAFACPEDLDEFPTTVLFCSRDSSLLEGDSFSCNTGVADGF
jgi:hypothetical protein